MKYFKSEQRVVNKKGVKNFTLYSSEEVFESNSFEVITKEEIFKEEFLAFVENNLRLNEVQDCLINNQTLTESFKHQDGAMYKYFWQFGVSEEDAKSIFNKINAELENYPKAFYANAKRTWGEYYYKGYAPENMKECSIEEMISEIE